MIASARGIATTLKTTRVLSSVNCMFRRRLTSEPQTPTIMAANLSHIPDAEKLSERVTRVLGCNPGPMTLQGTNCYLIGTGKSKILVDTGEVDNDRFLVNLKQTLKEKESNIQEILITHWHPDHVGGIEGVIKVIGKPVKISKMPQVKAQDAPLEGTLKYTYVQEGHLFSTEGATLKAVYTPGHTDDHMSLWLEEEKATLSGDTVLGEGTAVFEDLYDYMNSLEKIRSLESTLIYPAHGALVTNPHEHLTMYINHRNQREQQILNTISSASKSISVQDIVKSVYAGLAEHLVGAAINNANHHLQKLVKEGKIVSLEDGSYQIHKSNL